MDICESQKLKQIKYKLFQSQNLADKVSIAYDCKQDDQFLLNEIQPYETMVQVRLSSSTQNMLVYILKILTKMNYIQINIT